MCASLTSLPASEALALDLSAPDCVQLPSARSTSASELSSQRTGRTSRALPMSERYAALRLQSGQSMLFAQGSPVRTSVKLDVVPALRASIADYGLIAPASFANLDPSSLSWRTCQGCLFEGSTRYSQTWPQAGSMRNGTVYRLRPLAPRSYERASGFWPTVVASEKKRTTPYSQGGQSLTYLLGGFPSLSFLAWIMGYPASWLSATVLRSCRRSPSSLAGG